LHYSAVCPAPPALPLLPPGRHFRFRCGALGESARKTIRVALWVSSRNWEGQGKCFLWRCEKRKTTY